jgi:hypothetical protein
MGSRNMKKRQAAIISQEEKMRRKSPDPIGPYYRPFVGVASRRTP